MSNQQITQNSPPTSPVSSFTASPPASPTQSLQIPIALSASGASPHSSPRNSPTQSLRSRATSAQNGGIRNRRRTQVVNAEPDEAELIEQERRRLRELQNVNRRNEADDTVRGIPARPSMTMAMDLSSIRGRGSPVGSDTGSTRTAQNQNPDADPENTEDPDVDETASNAPIDDGTPKKWTPQEEIILRKWAEVAKSYGWMHNRAFYNYRWQNFWFSIPVIILSNLTGIANFAQSSIPDENPNKKMFPLVIGAVNITAGIIPTVYQFLKVSELLEAHRAAHIGYAKFGRDIETELMQIRTLRSQHGKDFLRGKHDEYDRLHQKHPMAEYYFLLKTEAHHNLN